MQVCLYNYIYAQWRNYVQINCAMFLCLQLNLLNVFNVTV